MRDVNNKVNKVDIAKVQPRQEVKASKVDEIVVPAAPTEEKVTADFSNPSAEVLGRSQVSPADALQKDVAFGMENPEAIEQADKFFNIALSHLEASGDENSYAKASELSSAYVNEFSKK